MLCHFIKIVGAQHTKTLLAISEREQSVHKSSMRTEVFRESNFRIKLVIWKREHNSESAIRTMTTAIKNGRVRLVSQNTQ